MTTQDIEKLKAFCDEKGIEMIPTADRHVWGFKSKDKWDGVEFAECVDWIGDMYSPGMIYPLNRLSPFTDVKNIHKSKFKPSTESAYVEQLKAKAHELYGEIKDGDRFDASMFGSSNNVSININDDPIWSYSKGWDLLSLGGFRLYQQGKWAKKVEKPIKANITSLTLSNPYSTIVFTTSHRIKEGQVDVQEFMNHIEESIEAFLNRKI